MAIVDERMWWLPAWLDRLLPDLDIEGEGLVQRLDKMSGANPTPALEHTGEAVGVR